MKDNGLKSFISDLDKKESYNVEDYIENEALKIAIPLLENIVRNMVDMGLLESQEYISTLSEYLKLVLKAANIRRGLNENKFNQSDINSFLSLDLETQKQAIDSKYKVILEGLNIPDEIYTKYNFVGEINPSESDQSESQIMQ